MKILMAFTLLCMFPLFSFSKEVFTYQNPIKNGIEGGIRDAQIFMDGGKYYLTFNCQNESTATSRAAYRDDYLNQPMLLKT